MFKVLIKNVREYQKPLWTNLVLDLIVFFIFLKFLNIILAFVYEFLPEFCASHACRSQKRVLGYSGPGTTDGL